MTRQMDVHVTLLGILHIAYSIVHLLGIGIAMGFLLVSGFFERQIFHNESPFLLFFLFFILFFVALFSIPGLIGGIGLLNKKNWARILVLIVGIVNLVSIPFGTALGIYTLWVLLKPETIAIFLPQKTSG